MPATLSTQHRDPGPFPAGRRCTFIAPARAGQLGYDARGRCITRLHTNHEGGICHCHELSMAEDQADAVIREAIEAAA